jgi:hypothetical protein
MNVCKTAANHTEGRVCCVVVFEGWQLSWVCASIPRYICAVTLNSTDEAGLFRTDPASTITSQYLRTWTRRERSRNVVHHEAQFHYHFGIRCANLRAKRHSHPNDNRLMGSTMGYKRSSQMVFRVQLARLSRQDPVNTDASALANRRQLGSRLRSLGRRSRWRWRWRTLGR